PHPDPTYAAFAARAEAVGHAPPGWRDLTQAPVAEDAYTLREHRGPHRGRRRHGRAHRGRLPPLKAAASGRRLETRSGSLTLNVPLQPGSAVTEETRDARNTLQRWQVERDGTGHRPVNGITRRRTPPRTDGSSSTPPTDAGPPSGR
ncbi:glycosyl hydrolase family 20, partial [Streptomyces alfalfae]